jgi:hypothetical protein
LPQGLPSGYVAISALTILTDTCHYVMSRSNLLKQNSI